MVPEDDVAQEILRSIRQLVRQIAIHSKQLLRDVGLTVPQMVCLRAISALDTGGGVTVVDISQRVQLSPATVSRVVDRLGAAGLITRERNTIDRRKVGITLTPAGIDRVTTLPTPLQETFLTGLAALGREERQDLLEALRRIVDLMSAGELDAAPILTSGSRVKQ